MYYDCKITLTAKVNTHETINSLFLRKRKKSIMKCNYIWFTQKKKKKKK